MKYKELFSLENIGGRLQEIKMATEKNLSSAVFYATQNSRFHIASNLQRFFLYVVPDRITARNASKMLSAYMDEEIPIIFEREDVLIKGQTLGNFNLSERIKAMANILTGKVSGAVISAEALLQYYPSKKNFRKNIVKYSIGDKIEIEEFLKYLVNIGFERRSSVEEKGTFFVRGDIIYINSFSNENPIRIELFDNEIEKIKEIDSENMSALKSLDNITIIPSSDIIFEKEEIYEISRTIEKEKKGAGLKLSENLLEMKSKFLNNPNSPNNNWLLPFMKDFMDSILSYLPKNSAIIFDECRAIDDKLKLLSNAHTIRVKSFIENGEASNLHKDALINIKSLYYMLEKFTKIGFLNITSNNPIFKPQEIFSIKSQMVPRYFNNFSQFVSDMKGYVFNKAKVFVYCNNYNASAIIDSLKENFIGAKILEDKDNLTDINIVIGELPSGFIYPSEKIIVIGQEDLIKKRESEKKRKRKELVLPEKGDYVVHEKHGVGISEGMMSIKTSDGYKDYYVVLYRGGDKLYLPANQLDTLEKYSGGENPTIHKLGGAEFDRIKKRAKESIKKMTIDLLKLYEKRHSMKGHIYSQDTPWQKEMENNFEFTDTPDQIIATNEIKEDMEKGKIMDRLLCGDVGYGKTEVAIRAIFKTVLEGKQAALLAPTTILAQQHFNTISERLNIYKIKIALLSRFVPQSQIKENLKEIKTGKINIVVGTHRLLSKDVAFFDLGLLVLDEEQRFGVEHKEKIKTFRNNVNVLSLSATPIPRTLHMSLSGIRDISILETPPENRMPIETYVTEYSDALVLDAVRREISRGGQVFILYNKVSTIEAFFKHIQELVGNIPMIYAHGQMSPMELENRIARFYNQKAKVMISTTIIENGIDLPFANTLIVIDADNLGLSQLYQLRGRVGRSNLLAYAYFTVRQGKVLTENATKRLEALMENTELGSGLNIAMRDLDIRGAGNILGREQSGQMEKIGYNMYCKLIKDTLEEAQGKVILEKREIEIEIDVASNLPNDYIENQKERILFYKKVSSLETIEEAKELIKEINDIYGKPERNVLNLITISLIKNKAQTLQIKKVVITRKGCGLYFYDEKCLQNESIIASISNMKNQAVLLPTDPPSIIFDAKELSLEAKSKLVMEFLNMVKVKN